MTGCSPLHTREECWPEDEIRAVRLRECIRLSPMEFARDCPLRFGIVDEYWRHVRIHGSGRCNGQLALANVGNVTYMVANFKTFELAWPVWIGSIHRIARTFFTLDSDEKIRAFE